MYVLLLGALEEIDVYFTRQPKLAMIESATEKLVRDKMLETNESFT